MTASAREGNLGDIRVIELADEQAEYTGRLLAGLGADVIKIEPPGGNSTRAIGPFYEDEPGPERSLFFWHYNLGKRSVVLDLDEREEDREKLLELLGKADVFVESTRAGYLDGLGLGKDTLLERFPNLVVARISPFGDDGPWKDYKGSDLVHLALGGPMMNCGYDPQPDGTYDLPPIAPQMWQAYHIAGELLGINIMGALLYRRRTGEGQYLSCAVHDAVSKNTEVDMMTWIFRHATCLRQTCRHAQETVSDRPLIGPTKDGRWFMTWGLSGNKASFENLVAFLDDYGMAADLKDPRYLAEGAQTGRAAVVDPEFGYHQTEVMQRLLLKYRYDDVPWRDAQDAGFMWAPLRKPHENALDEHWLTRNSFAEVEHEDLGKSFTYTTSKWVSTEAPWKVGPRAPHVGEHTAEVFAELAPEPHRASTVTIVPSTDTRRSRRGTPFALDGVRILDFTWWLASGGAPRFLSALGADDIKVEWKGALDLRMGRNHQLPIGGREARATATGPLEPDLSTINRSGQFNDYHAGQRGISLNIRHPKGLELARQLVAQCDIVAEGFSPGVMESWGLGYDELRKIKPDIIYVQQSGLGAHGRYGKYRSIGPIAAAMSALSEMSGLPEPAPPAGWGYSYLDWFGAYNLATAMMAALNYRERTGKGQWIDSSQVDTGIYLNGTAVLDWSANSRPWQRYGNRSPYKPAAPHGAFRCAGVDRWLAIACFDEQEWSSLVGVMGAPAWASDARFATLEKRLQHQDELDAWLGEWTSTRDAYEAMHALQRAGVRAGVCQTAEDRYEHDEQLAHLEWLTEVTGTEIGTWPVREVPVKMSATPPFMGGPTDRGAPCYGEDNAEVFGELLGISPSEIAALAEEGVI